MAGCRWSVRRGFGAVTSGESSRSRSSSRVRLGPVWSGMVWYGLGKVCLLVGQHGREVLRDFDGAAGQQGSRVGCTAGNGKGPRGLTG